MINKRFLIVFVYIALAGALHQYPPAWKTLLLGLLLCALYLSVLEHIENDQEEILNALERLEEKGHLIICAPAHNYMYSNFDKEIGHFRRYEIDFFDTLTLKNANVKKCFFLDSFGHLLYFLNKLLFSKEIYPSKLKVFIWDKIFIPITYIIDFLSFYKFVKNIICIIQKNNTK